MKPTSHNPHAPTCQKCRHFLVNQGACSVLAQPDPSLDGAWVLVETSANAGACMRFEPLKKNIVALFVENFLK